MEAFELELPDPEATRRLGQLMGQLLAPGMTIALDGELGTGKTALSKAIVAQQGQVPEDDVISPTFVLAAEYPGRVPILHLDAYRLAGPADLRDLGFELDRPSARAVLVEWAERVADALPSDRVRVVLDHAPPGRRVNFRGLGPASEAWVESLRQLGSSAGFSARAT